MTSALEIIHLRCNEPGVEEAMAAIVELLTALSDTGARLYRSATVPNDLSIHLVHGSNSLQRGAASETALMVTRALEHLGQVHHTRWIEADKRLQNEGPTS